MKRENANWTLVVDGSLLLNWHSDATDIDTREKNYRHKNLLLYMAKML